MDCRFSPSFFLLCSIPLLAHHYNRFMRFCTAEGDSLPMISTQISRSTAVSLLEWSRLSWWINNGMVEGHITKLKLIKRQGYGRAAFPLLRKRVLHAFYK